MEFEISPNLEYYRELIYTNQRDSYFRSPHLRGAFLKAIVYLGIALLLAFLSYALDWASWEKPLAVTLAAALTMVFILAQFLALIWLLVYGYKAWALKKWIKQTNEWLDRLGKSKVYKVVVTPEHLAVLIDAEQKYLNWSTVLQSDLTENFVSITYSDYAVLVPAKCMKPGEFEVLSAMVQERLGGLNGISEG